MPTQGTTTKDINQKCTDVAFHGEGTRPSWQTSLITGSTIMIGSILQHHHQWKHMQGKRQSKKAKDTRTQGCSGTVIG